MLQGKNQITIRQTIILFFISIFSPAIRILPNIGSRLGREAVWVGPIISSLALYMIFTVLGQFFKNNKIGNIGDIFDHSMGKFFGVVTRFIYLFWIFILFLLYVRYYAERLVSSIFKNTDIQFFILVMMIVVFIAIRGRLEVFTRFGEISFFIFTAITIMFLLFLLPTVKIENIYPLTDRHIVPAIKSAYPVLGLWGYITFFMFLGDHIKDKNLITNYRRKYTIFLTFMTVLLLVILVGSLGYRIAIRMSLPFFGANKMISFAESFDRFESVLLSAWVITDFVIISSFAIIIMHTIKGIFKLTCVKHLSFPIALAGYYGSLKLAGSRFEIEVFSRDIALMINIILGFVVPVIVFGIGKLRKKI